LLASPNHSETPVPNTAAHDTLAADILLRWKRLMGEEEAVTARLARASRDPVVKGLAGQLQQVRAEYSRLVNVEPKPEALTTVSKVRTATLSKLESLEIALKTRSRGYADQAKKQEATWQQVQMALPQNTALLELRAFQPVDLKSIEFGESHWLALLLEAAGPVGTNTSDRGPRFIDLGPVATSEPHRVQMARLTEEDVCLARFLAKLNNRPYCANQYDRRDFSDKTRARARKDDISAELDQTAEALYASLLGPLDRELARFETLYISPDGVLDLVPFSRLRLPDGRFWITRQNLRQVRSGRDLIAGPPVQSARGVLALGAVDYDAVTHKTGQRPTEFRAAEMLASTETDNLPSSSPRLSTTCRVFTPLPNTAIELDDLERRFDRDEVDMLVLKGRDASEARLNSYSPPPRILHLATHGCFINRSDPVERPMALSLLALAGANHALADESTTDNHDDGILHALEVVGLNLAGTELVTLSACDTGKGEVDTSEGVYGLVRAFQIAGAANVLMTLRTLDDALAAEFMSDFYRNWVNAPPGTPAHPALALRRTQLDWIESKRPEKRDPRHWAPYVLVERR